MWRSGKDVGTSTFILPLLKVKRGKGWIAWDDDEDDDGEKDDDDDDNDDDDDEKSFVLMGWIDCFLIAAEERLRGEVREGQAGQKSQVRIIPGVLGQRDHFCIVTWCISDVCWELLAALSQL